MRDFVYIQDCVAFQYNLFTKKQEAYQGGMCVQGKNLTYKENMSIMEKFQSL